MRPIPNTTTHPVHWFSNIHCSDAKSLESYLKKPKSLQEDFFFL